MVLPNRCLVVISDVVVLKTKRWTTELEAHLLLLRLIAAKAIYNLAFFPGGNITLSSNQTWLCLAHLTTLRDDLITSA